MRAATAHLLGEHDFSSFRASGCQALSPIKTLHRIDPAVIKAEVLKAGFELAEDSKLLAYAFDGVRYDTGDRLGFIDATLAFALKRPDLADAFRRYLEDQRLV